MKRISRALFVSLGIALVAGLPVYAQLTTGTVSGTVLDPQDAVVPLATVRLTHPETGTTRELETNSQGAFVFDRVRPGSYTLTVAREGFRTHEVRDLHVVVAQVADLHIKLEVGVAAETVTIEAPTVPLIQADSPEIVGAYDARKVAEINWGLFGADATSFMTPGVVPGFGNINANTGGFGAQVGGDSFPPPAAAGQRARSTQFNVDGHEINDISIGGPSMFISNQDIISEYQVSVNSFDASEGRLPGAQVNILTKSGTNDIHGSAFWFYEANSLRSRTSFESTDDSEKPKLIQQTYGGTVGGPIIKNKWFGFGSYERFKIPGSVLAQGTTAELILTQASATAVAAAAPNAATQAYRDSGPFTISDGNPQCRAGLTVTQGIANGWPINGVQLCGVERNVPQDEEFWEYSLRMDVTLNKQTFFGRWFDQLDKFCCSGDEDGYWIAIPNRGQSLSLGHTYQFTPRVLNDFHFSFGRFIVAFEGGNTFPISDLSANLTRFNLPTNYEDIGLANNLPQNRLLYNFQWADHVSIVTGRHTIKAGLEFRRNRSTTGFLPNVNGTFNFANITQFSTNAAGSTAYASGDFKFQPFETDQFYFIQDDFRLRPNLTINIGMRYENIGQPVNTIHNTTVARETGNYGTPLWNPNLPLEDRTFPEVPVDDNNWGPRIGFAYTPRWGKAFFGEDQTVIRGGYSIAYEAAFYNILLNVETTAPNVFSFTLTPGIPVPAGATGSAVAATIPTPFGTRDPREFTRTTVAPNFHAPYVQHWSLGMQRELGEHMVAEGRYVGSHSIGQFQSVNANPRFTNLFNSFPSAVPSGVTPCPAGSAPSTFVNPNASQGRVFCDATVLRSRDNSARATYHGLQTRLDYRNWLNQLTGGIGFTWGKTIDNVSEIFGFQADAGSTAFAQNYFDVVEGETGLSNNHLGRTFTAHWIWDVPAYRDQQGALGKLLGGWQYTGQLFLYDGRPWTATQFIEGNTFCGQDTAFNTAFIGTFETCRPYLADSSAPMNTQGPVGTPGVHWWVNDCAAATCLPFGAGRNSNVFGDGSVLANMSFTKNTKFGPEGRFNMQFRTMIVNIFNHRNFGPPASLDVTDTDFGLPNRNDAPGRIIRFALRLTF
jgi:hypothetical protein